LKNPEAIRTQQVFGSEIIPPIPVEKVLLLTGTPVINYVHDLYSQLHFLDSTTWPSFEQFLEDQYFPGYKVISPSQIVGVERNLEHLRRQVQAVMVRRPKSILNLPAKTREIVEVDIADHEFWSNLAEQKKSLRLLQRQLMTLLEGSATGAARAIIRDLDAKINALTSCVRRQVGMNKLPTVIEYLRGRTGKTLVFAYHHDVIARLMETLAAQGVSGFTGSSSLRERDRAAEEFQHDPNCQFFIGNIEAAGQGITLTAARHVVFAEPDWRGTYLEQAEDRAHRIGQTHPVLVTYLLLQLSQWSTDSWMNSKITGKQAAIDAVLGSPEEENSIRMLAMSSTQLLLAEDA
jgi:SWI/SNF-related matrix-associated actin-dependent regulator 1 of chromatin subfamily A